MAFNRDKVSDLLVQCKRHCCICNRYCGVKIETDHMLPAHEGGSDDIENAIPVCFDCHAEIHAYDPKHPRGRKFTLSELKGHKENWLNLCSTHPELFIGMQRSGYTEVGPLQSLIDELEFNLSVSQSTEKKDMGCFFRDVQFSKAIDAGSIAILHSSVKNAVLEAYVAMGGTNQIIDISFSSLDGRVSRSGTSSTGPVERLNKCTLLIKNAHEQLINYLGPNEHS